MTESSFQRLLDELDNGKSTVLDVCKSYYEDESSPKITDEQFNQHPFFTKRFSEELCKILEHWVSEGTLNDDQREPFQVYSQFLLKLTGTSRNSKRWLNQQTELIESTEKCLNEIASFGYYISIGGEEDPNLEAFDWLIQSFKNTQCPQFLDLLVKCVTCGFYMDAFYLLKDTDISALTITQRFFLITCPDYILQCDTNKTYTLKVVNTMLPNYDEIFSEMLPDIEQWSKPLILCIIYPMQLILTVVRKLTFEQRKFIYPVILTILLNKSTTDLNIDEVHPLLIYTSLCLLIEIMRSDKDLANQLKNKTDKKSDLINILNKLSKENKDNDKIQLKAIALIALLIPETEFLKENKTEKITEVFITNLTKALEQDKTKEIDDVLSGIKGRWFFYTLIYSEFVCFL